MYRSRGSDLTFQARYKKTSSASVQISPITTTWLDEAVLRRRLLSVEIYEAVMINIRIMRKDTIADEYVHTTRHLRTTHNPRYTQPDITWYISYHSYDVNCKQIALQEMLLLFLGINNYLLF